MSVHRCARRWLLISLFISLLLTIAKQVCDFVGRLWLPILVNFVHVLFVIFGLFGGAQNRPVIVILAALWLPPFLVWNIFLFCHFFDVPPLDRDSKVLSFGAPFSHSVWLEHWPFCSTYIDPTTGSWESGTRSGSTCPLPWFYVECAVALCHFLVAFVAFDATIVYLCAFERGTSVGRGLDSVGNGYGYGAAIGATGQRKSKKLGKGVVEDDSSEQAQQGSVTMDGSDCISYMPAAQHSATMNQSAYQTHLNRAEVLENRGFDFSPVQRYHKQNSRQPRRANNDAVMMVENEEEVYYESRATTAAVVHRRSRSHSYNRTKQRQARRTSSKTPEPHGNNNGRGLSGSPGGASTLDTRLSPIAVGHGGENVDGQGATVLSSFAIGADASDRIQHSRMSSGEQASRLAAHGDRVAKVSASNEFMQQVADQRAKQLRAAEQNRRMLEHQQLLAASRQGSHTSLGAAANLSSAKTPPPMRYQPNVRQHYVRHAPQRSSASAIAHPSFAPPPPPAGTPFASALSQQARAPSGASRLAPGANVHHSGSASGDSGHPPSSYRGESVNENGFMAHGQRAPAVGVRAPPPLYESVFGHLTRGAEPPVGPPPPRTHSILQSAARQSPLHTPVRSRQPSHETFTNGRQVAQGGSNCLPASPSVMVAETSLLV